MIIVIPLLAFALCVLLHIAAVKLFPKLGFLDFPERYGLRRPRLPYPTGVIAIVTFLIFFVTTTINIQHIGILTGILLLGITSFIDDRTPLPPSLRLAIQIIAALIIFATGSRIYTITNPLESLTGLPYLKLDSFNIIPEFSIFPFEGLSPSGSNGNFQFSIPVDPLPLLSGMFTLVWLCLAMNALNWFDGIPGQVSGLSAIGFAVIGLLAISSRVNQPSVALLAFTLAAIAAACLLFDFPPPRVLMGDTGAMFFGLMLGVLTIYAGGKVATAFLAFGVPFADCLIVTARRMLSGHSPFHGSAAGEHLHHRLLAAGWPPRHVILFNVLFGSVFGVSALFLNTAGKFIAGLLLVLCMIALHARTYLPQTKKQ